MENQLSFFLPDKSGRVQRVGSSPVGTSSLFRLFKSSRANDGFHIEVKHVFHNLSSSSLTAFYYSPVISVANEITLYQILLSQPSSSAGHMLDKKDYKGETNESKAGQVWKSYISDRTAAVLLIQIYGFRRSNQDRCDLLIIF